MALAHRVPFPQALARGGEGARGAFALALQVALAVLAPALLARVAQAQHGGDQQRGQREAAHQPGLQAPVGQHHVRVAREHHRQRRALHRVAGQQQAVGLAVVAGRVHDLGPRGHAGGRAQRAGSLGPAAGRLGLEQRCAVGAQHAQARVGRGPSPVEAAQQKGCVGRHHDHAVVAPIVRVPGHGQRDPGCAVSGPGGRRADVGRARGSACRAVKVIGAVVRRLVQRAIGRLQHAGAGVQQQHLARRRQRGGARAQHRGGHRGVGGPGAARDLLGRGLHGGLRRRQRAVGLVGQGAGEGREHAFLAVQQLLAQRGQAHAQAGHQAGGDQQRQDHRAVEQQLAPARRARGGGGAGGAVVEREFADRGGGLFGGHGRGRALPSTIADAGTHRTTRHPTLCR